MRPRRAAGRGHWVAAADVAARITWAAGLAAGRDPDTVDRDRVLAGRAPAWPRRSRCPAAFAVLAAAPDDPWLACRIAASLGGDCDTIAAMAGAIGGACHGVDAFPQSARGTRSRGSTTCGWTRSPRDLLRAAQAGREAGRDRPGRLPFDRLLHLGNVVVDVVLDVPALPERGGDVLADRTADDPGRWLQRDGRRRPARAAGGLRGRARQRAVRRPGPRGLAEAGIEVLSRRRPTWTPGS